MTFEGFSSTGIFQTLTHLGLDLILIKNLYFGHDYV